MATTRSKERDEFLSDIIIGAIEGGTGYWAQVHQYQYMMDGELHVYAGSRVDLDITRATVQELNDTGEDFTGDIHNIDAEVITRGIGKIVRGEVQINSRMQEGIKRADALNDAGEIDADDADVIVQVGLLGEIVYG